MADWKAKPTRFQDGFGTEFTRVQLGGGSQLDAFGRVRVSNPALTLFDSQMQYNDQPLLWFTKTIGGGSTTHLPSEAALNLTVTADGDQVIRQTKAYHRYQPGKSQAIKCTGTFADGSGTTSIIQRTKVSGAVIEQRIAQGNWNFDNFDGKGVSGINTDWSKSQIFTLDLEWLSVGCVRTGFVYNGQIQIAHVFENENINPGAYMTTANLPVRYEVKVVGTTLIQRLGYFDDDNGIFFEHQSVFSGATSFKQICSVVESEGGFEEALGIPFSGDSGGSLITVTTTEVPLFSFRPKATFNGLVNRGTLLPLGFKALVQNNPVMFRVYHDAQLTGAIWNSADPNSIAEWDGSATAFSNGQQIFSVPVGASRQADGGDFIAVLSKLPITLDIDGANPINLTLTAQCISGVNADVAVGTFWRELY